MLSPDGISHSFDSRANGYGRGEAVGGFIVKPLAAALADGDTIRAVIRGTGANQDGKTPGITMPSGEAQPALINSTYASAGLSLTDTQYFEAHGTGTSLGVSCNISGPIFPHRKDMHRNCSKKLTTYYRTQSSLGLSVRALAKLVARRTCNYLSAASKPMSAIPKGWPVLPVSSKQSYPSRKASYLQMPVSRR